MRIASSLFLGSCFLLTVGCAEGRDVPASTEMATVNTGLTFTFGFAPDVFCVAPGTAGSQVPDCSTGGASIPIIWPQIQVELEPFEFDVHEVTNLQYEYCVAAGVCTDPKGFNAQDQINQRDYYEIEQFHSFPVVNITHEQAEIYCDFVGKRLPSEYEWERVAKGDPANGSRLFPIDGALNNSFETCVGNPDLSVFYCRENLLIDEAGVSSSDFVTEGTTKVFHMFGNVAEFVSSRYEADVQCMDDPPCLRLEDCAGCPDGTKTCAAYLQCANDSHRCTACDSSACHFVCESPDPNTVTEKQTIVCEPYPDVEVLTTADLEPITGADRIVRGGHVALLSSGACNLRSSFRDFNVGRDVAQPFVGFRCAR